MARPIKSGLDYFPMDVREDKKESLIFSKFGLIGKGLTIALLAEIYGEHGYYCDMSEEDKLIFAVRMKIDEEFLDEFLDLAFKIHLFDREMYDKYSILTSKSIQKIYFSAISRRKNIKYISEYLLMDFDDDITDEFLNANGGSYKNKF